MVKSPTKQVVVDKIANIRNVCRLALKLEDAIKDVMDEDETAKQTWNDLETDWPFVDAPNNLVNEAGLLVLSSDVGGIGNQEPVSFTGENVNQALKRLKDIHAYLQGPAGTLVIPANANRDINRLTIDG